MSDTPERREIAKKRMVYEVPGMNGVTVRRDVEYQSTDAGPLTMDIYYPHGAQGGSAPPAVIFVLGFSDLGAQPMLGRRLKEMGSFVSWAQLTAASGMAAITYGTGPDPAADIDALLHYLREHAASLGLDAHRIGLWACSGHVPNALSAIIEHPSALRCAVLCYGYLLDLDGFTDVADAAERFRFVNPSAGKLVDDLPPDVPLFIARAGRDANPQLNATLDRFVAAALRRNLPLTLVNQPAAPHAFDVMQDDEASRDVIKDILDFMRLRLLS